MLSGVASEAEAEGSVPLVPRLAPGIAMTGTWHSNATVSTPFTPELPIPAAQTGIVGS